MKILIVGGVAGGATTATRLRRLNEADEIIMFEKGEYISFANCGLPYYISNVIKEKSDLLVQKVEDFKNRFNIDVRTNEEVIRIDRENKRIEVKKIKEGKTYFETYDKLVLSPGAEPINPFKNLNSKKIFTLRTIEDAEKIKEYVTLNKPRNILIVGGGYIGIEMAENLSKHDVNVIIAEKKSHILGMIDSDMACLVSKELIKNNIKIYLGQGIENIVEGKHLYVKLEKDSLEVDAVVLCVGIKPESKLALESGLDVNPKGYIIVNEKMQTNDENIYALGDAVQTKNEIIGRKQGLALAGIANRQARIVASNIEKIEEEEYEGFISSSIIKVFDKSLGLVGLSEKECKEIGIQYKTMIITPYTHVRYYPGAYPITIKGIYEAKTGKILGASIWGKDKVDKITDILSVAVKMKMTAKDLSKLELCYAPPYSSAKSPINILGNSIENEINHLVDTITVKEVINNDSNGVYLLDVRTKEEYDLGHIEIKNKDNKDNKDIKVINIPLNELRKNIEKLNNICKENEIKELIVYCHSGMRSYIACRILSQKGFKVKNMIGGYTMYKSTNRDGLFRLKDIMKDKNAK